MRTLDPLSSSLDRRMLLRSATVAAGLTFASPLLTRAQGKPVDELVIDLTSEPDTLDPIYTYGVDGWSIVHVLYDAPLQYVAAGGMEMLAAQSITFVDDLTLEIVLRPGLTFSDGSTVTAKAIVAGLEAIASSDSQIKGNFTSVASADRRRPSTP